MSRTRVIRIASAIFWCALLAYQVWRGIQDFQAFQAENPESGLVDYLLNPRPYFWLGIIVVIGFCALAAGFSALMAKWDRAGNNAEREDPDAESKRMFTEARGE